MLKREDITLSFVTLERANFLAQSLNSVREFPNIIVFDNGTKNKSNKMLIKALAKKRKASLICSVSNDGLPRAWNQCIIQAKTDWVVLCPDDVVFRDGWFSDINEILKIRPNTKIIFGNNYDMIMIHKSIIPAIGWWEERYKQYPSSEDFDHCCRLTEIMGFAPYVMPGDHVQGPERRIRLSRKTTKDQYFSDANFTYWCTSEFSICEPLCHEIPHPKTCDYFERNPSQETGYDFHDRKWKVAEKGLLNIDGQYWERLLPDIDFYPEITEEYWEKYK